MSKAVESLREALYATGLVQPLDSDGRGGYVYCLCRQVPGQEASWIKTVDQLLTAADGSVDLHVCRRYVRREGRMVFGWFIAVETKNAKDLVTAVDVVVEVLKGARASLTVAPAAPHQSQYRDRQSVVEKKVLGGQNQHGTNAGRRAPEYVGPDPESPENFRPMLRTISSGTDSKGRVHDVVEMQLPHVYGDMNVPKHKDGKGAKSIAGD